MRLTIGKKLAGSFIVVLILMTSLASYLVNTSQIALEEAVGSGSIALGKEILTRIDQSLYLKSEEVQNHSRHTIFRDFVSESNEQFAKILDVDTYINTIDLEWISAPKKQQTPFMQELLNNHISKDLIREFIEPYEIKYGYRILTEIYITNRYGAIIAATGRTSDYFQADEKWYQQALEERDVWIGDIEYDESSGVFGNDIVVKLYDDKDKFSGIFKAVMNTGRIIREIEIAKKEYDTTRIKLITNGGKLIYGTKTFRYFEDLSSKNFFKKITGESGFYISEAGGSERLYSYTRSKGFRDFEGFGWLLVVEHDVEEILKPTFDLKKRMLLASIILIVSGAVFFLIISRSLTRPIEKLTQSTALIGKGELTHRVDIKTNDEIGVLSKAFNKMVGDLEKITASRDELNKEINERIITEEKLRASEARYQDLYDNAPDMFVSVDPETSLVLQCNQTLATTLGYSKEEIIGRQILDLYHHDSLDDAQKAFRLFVETGEVYGEELLLKRKNGTSIDVSLNVSALRNEDGRIIHSRSSWRDISERKRVEEEIRELNEFLEVRIEKRTAELNRRISEVEQLNSAMVNLLEDHQVSKESLESTTKQLAETNSELEAFAYSVSHDLRAPLRAITGFSEMLVEDYGKKLDETGQRQLGVIQNSARDMGQLIDDLLTFSRLGRKSLKMSPINMHALAAEVIGMLKVGEETREMNLKISKLANAIGDPALIREVFVNLLSNAMKYTRPKEEPTIEVHSKTEEDEHIYFIKDNGVGFDMKYGDKLFQVFQRLHTAEEFEGTGIGLALVQRIVHRHGGRVGGEGKVNEGATFYFALPKRDA